MDRVKLGLIGCGAIAQVQHMPNLHEMQDLFEVTWTCDVSARLAEYLAGRFAVPRHTTDYRRLLDAKDVDAVLLCHRDPKTEIAVAALAAGKHTFIEKPMCFAMVEARAIVGAAESAKKVAQVGYMKVYDPAYEIARAEAEKMTPVFVQVNHLHPDNRHHLAQFRLQRFDDVPPEAGRTSQAAREKALRQAIGKVLPEVERAFFTLAGSMIHDLYGMRLILGMPGKVASTEIWREGRAISTVLDYASGARCVASWVDLPDLWEFKETLEIHGDAKRVCLSYPTGFARGILSEVTIHEASAAGMAEVRRPAVDWESPFARELRHFHACIKEGQRCRTPASEAADDIRLIIDIIQACTTGRAVAVARA